MLQNLIIILVFMMIVLLALRLFFWLLGLLSWLFVPMLFFWVIARLFNFVRHGGTGGSNSTTDGNSGNSGRWHSGTWTSGSYTGWYTGWGGSGTNSRNTRSSWGHYTGNSWRGHNTGNTGGANSGTGGGYTQGANMTREQALAVFGLPITASKDDIRKRYREYVKKYHPDRLGSDAAPETRKAAEERFARINAAHEFLTR